MTTMIDVVLERLPLLRLNLLLNLLRRTQHKTITISLAQVVESRHLLRMRAEHWFLLIASE